MADEDHPIDPVRAAWLGLSCSGLALLALSASDHAWAVGHDALAGGWLDRACFPLCVGMAVVSWMSVPSRGDGDERHTLASFLDVCRLRDGRRMPGDARLPAEARAAKPPVAYGDGDGVSADLRADMPRLGLVSSFGDGGWPEHYRQVGLMAVARSTARDQAEAVDARGLAHRLAMARAAGGGGRDATEAILEGGLRPAWDEALTRTHRSHGTAVTALLSLLDAEGRFGRVSPTEFAWLKGVDRNLWYAILGLGRPTCHAEGLAAQSHYRAEIAGRHAIREPDLDAVVGALRAFHAGRTGRKHPAEAA